MQQTQPQKPLLTMLTNLAYGLMVLVLLSLAGVTLLSVLRLPKGPKVYAVSTGSMRPTIPVGSVVVVEPANTYHTGDIITFKSPKDRLVEKPKYTNTHRIVGTQVTDVATYFTTKGDANPEQDGDTIDANLIIGRVVLTVPLLGYLLMFLKSPWGLVSLIIIPGCMVAFVEMNNVIKEVRLLLNQRKAQL